MTQEPEKEKEIEETKPLGRIQKIKNIGSNWKNKIPFVKTKGLLTPSELQTKIDSLDTELTFEKIIELEEKPIIKKDKDKKNENGKTEADLLKKLEQQKQEQQKLLNEELNKPIETDTPYSPMDNPIKSNEIESTISLGLKEGLIEPKNIRHFTDLNSRQVSFSTLGIGYGQSIFFPEYIELFEILFDLSVSSGRKGRTEVKEVGIAGVQREQQTGLLDKLQFWKGRD